MVPLAQIPLFIHLATIWWGGCLYLLTEETFKSRRFATPVTMEDPRRRRARHRAISIAVAVLAAAALLSFASAFLPDDMRRGFWPA